MTTYPQTPPTPVPPPAPAPIRLGVLGLSVLVGVSSGVGIWASLFGFPGRLWGFFGFESVTLIAAVLGLLAGVGKFRSGFGLACLCVAGAILTGAIFGLYLDARLNAPTPREAGLVRAAILFRLAAAGLTATLGGLAVLLRDGRSWGMLLRGVVVASPALVTAAWLLATRGSALTVPLGSTAATARTVGIVLGGLLLMVLFSVGAHLCIRAFEITRPDDRPPGSG